MDENGRRNQRTPQVRHPTQTRINTQSTTHSPLSSSSLRYPPSSPMENPFGHLHHHRYDDDDDEQPPPQPYPPPSSYPPPPPFSSFPHQPPPYPPYPTQSPPYPPYPHQSPPFPLYPNQPPAYPPPAQPTGVFHTSHSGVDSRPYPPQPTAAYAHHEAHAAGSGGAGGEQHHSFHHPHMPGFITDHIHSQHGHQSEGGPIPELANRPSVRVFTKAETNYMLAIRDGKVILARSNSNDPTQHWVKDEKYSTKVKDQDGFPSFALVNKATGQALKHSTGATHPVQLIAYKSDVLDESILWTVGKDLGEGYRQIRMINNIRLVVDAVNGAKKSGGVHDGTTIALWQPGKGDNQRWKIAPY